MDTNTRQGALRALVFSAAALALAGCAELVDLPDPSDVTMQKETPPDNDAGYCGDDRAEADEACDGDDLRGVWCEDLGYDGGALACAGDCRGFDVSACTGAGVCGNGYVDPGEECDEGLDPDTRCYEYGVPCEVCLDDCTLGEGDYSRCGDDIVDEEAGEELCDGATLYDTCDGLGWSDGGTLACADDCMEYDTSACLGTNCGDGEIQGDETCDDGADNADACPYGETACTLCRTDCTEGPGTTSYCGDGIVDGDREDCEGDDVLLSWCADGSDLGCTDTCKWDVDACEPAVGSDVGVDVSEDTGGVDVREDTGGVDADIDEEVPDVGTASDAAADTETDAATDADPVRVRRQDDGCATAHGPTTGLGFLLATAALVRRRRR